MKRIFRLIFILFAVSVISFWICSHTDTDPIEQWCMIQHNENEGLDCFTSEKARLKRKEWGLDLPLFYIDIGTLAEPDTLYKISDKKTQRAAILWLQHCGDWKKVQNYLQTVYSLSNEHQAIQNQHLADSNYFEYQKTAIAIHSLLHESNLQEMKGIIDSLSLFYQQKNLPSSTLLRLTDASKALSEKKFIIRNYIPRLSFLGLNNQYHHWLMKVLKGDFGNSYRTNQPVSERIGEFVARSAMFAFLSFILAYMIAIPMAIVKTVYHDKAVDKVTDVFIFIINALPSFVIAIFLIILFANPDIFDWFLPAYNYSGTWFSRATLPLIAYTIGSANYYTVFIESMLITEMQQDYIRTAYAKGLKANLIYLRHAFKNILVPLFTSSASLLPSLIGGSIVLEYVFSIGGMGEEAFTAVQNLDIPMILAIMTITGLLTVLGYMVTDIASQWVDKRIKR